MLEVSGLFVRFDCSLRDMRCFVAACFLILTRPDPPEILQTRQRGRITLDWR